MKILLAAKYTPDGPVKIGGVQSWITTVRAQLLRRGHQVAVWQPKWPLKGTFDLGILAHWQLTRGAAKHCERTINVSHGIIEPEKPGDADRIVSVSEGVWNFWGAGGTIIRQPIDLEFWTGTGSKRTEAVRFSYRKTGTFCEQAAKHLGLPYRHVSSATAESARDILSRAAVVFASGRAALEAMACGAPVVIYDHRKTYQGPLMDDDVIRQMVNSYSGRGGWEPTLDDLVAAAQEARQNRAWIEKHHDAVRIVDRLLA